MNSPSINQYHPGTVLTVGSHQVRVIKYLTSGGFAQIYSAEISPADPFTGSNIACLKRVVVPDKPSLNSLRAEVDAMKLLRNNRNVVSYIDSHAAKANFQNGSYEVFLLMEYCERGGLIDFLNTRLQHRLQEPEVLNIMSQTAQGIAAMHALQPALIHRDIKIENVLISCSGDFKVCDFGSVCGVIRPPRTNEEFNYVQHDILKNTTAQYRSPEMIDLSKGLPIDEKSDIWALGVYLYKLCYYTTPFEKTGETAILSGKFQFPSFPHYSDRLKNLISQMLRVPPNERPNIYHLVEEISNMQNVPCPIVNFYALQENMNRMGALSQVQSANNTNNGMMMTGMNTNNGMLMTGSSSVSLPLPPSSQILMNSVPAQLQQQYMPVTHSMSNLQAPQSPQHSQLPQQSQPPRDIQSSQKYQSSQQSQLSQKLTGPANFNQTYSSSMPSELKNRNEIKAAIAAARQESTNYVDSETQTTGSFEFAKGSSKILPEVSSSEEEDEEESGVDSFNDESMINSINLPPMRAKVGSRRSISIVKTPDSSNGGSSISKRAEFFGGSGSQKVVAKGNLVESSKALERVRESKIENPGLTEQSSISVSPKIVQDNTKAKEELKRKMLEKLYKSERAFLSSTVNSKNEIKNASTKELKSLSKEKPKNSVNENRKQKPQLPPKPDHLRPKKPEKPAFLSGKKLNSIGAASSASQ